MAAASEPILDTGPMTVLDVVTTLTRAGFADHGMGDYGESVVQVTLDGETFYSLVGPVDYSDGGVVFELTPWPPARTTPRPLSKMEGFIEALVNPHTTWAAAPAARQNDGP